VRLNENKALFYLDLTKGF